MSGQGAAASHPPSSGARSGHRATAGRLQGVGMGPCGNHDKDAVIAVRTNTTGRLHRDLETHPRAVVNNTRHLVTERLPPARLSIRFRSQRLQRGDLRAVLLFRSSQSFWRLSQNSPEAPKKRPRRRVVSPVTDRRPLRIPVMRLTGTAMRRANSVALMPSASSHHAASRRDGWVRACPASSQWHVDDFNFGRPGTALGPCEADPPLIVDAHAPLSPATALDAPSVDCRAAPGRPARWRHTSRELHAKLCGQGRRRLLPRGPSSNASVFLSAKPTITTVHVPRCDRTARIPAARSRLRRA